MAHSRLPDVQTSGGIDGANPVCISLTSLFFHVSALYVCILGNTILPEPKNDITACIPFLPSLILMALAFAYCWPAHTGDSIPTVLFYPTLTTRMITLLIRHMNYFLSFSPDLERRSFYIAAAGAIALLIYLSLIHI